MVLELVVNNKNPPVRTVEVDMRDAHPTIVFFQDSETRFTVAVERISGRFLGHSGEAGVMVYVQKNILDAVKEYKVQCRKALQE